MFKIVLKHYVISFVVLISFIGGYFYFSGGEDVLEYESVIVERQDLIQEVDVTGHLEPFKVVDLAFERTGKIVFVGAEVGDRVTVGDELLKIDSKDLLADLAQVNANINFASANVENAKVGVKIAQLQSDSDELHTDIEIAQLGKSQADLAVEEAKLAEVKSGPIPEAIEIAKIKVENAVKSFDDLDDNYEKVLKKANTDIDNLYSTVLSQSSSAINFATTAILFVTDIQYDYFINSNDDYGSDISREKASAILAIYDERNAGDYNKNAITRLSGGLLEKLAELEEFYTYDDLDSFLFDIKDSLFKVKQMLDIVPYLTVMSNSDVNLLEEYKNSINKNITIITDLQNAIDLQKVVNEQNLFNADLQLNEAKNSLDVAKSELNLSHIGATEEQIFVQEASINIVDALYKIQVANVRKAESDLALPRARIDQASMALKADYSQLEGAQADRDSIYAEIDKTIIKAPFSGLVSVQDGKEGEIVTANGPLVTLISDGHYKIEAFVPEVDIAKIEIGDSAKFTLDALTDREVFNATVIKIDPAETMIEGLTTYKVTLDFETEDTRIRSNMTVNLEILTDKREGSIALLQRAIIEKDGSKYVRVLKNGIIEEIVVETGIIANDGFVEILSGIEEGDEVVTYIKE